MNTPVNFEIAKLLKEKGYNEPCFKGWDLSEEDTKPTFHEYTTLCKNSDCIETFYSAPTIAEVVMWLYEKHGIWISVSITIQKEYYYQCIDITGKKCRTKNNYPSRICKPGNYYNSPTEAYEAGIEYTLKNLIK